MRQLRNILIVVALLALFLASGCATGEYRGSYDPGYYHGYTHPEYPDYEYDPFHPHLYPADRGEEVPVMSREKLPIKSR